MLSHGVCQFHNLRAKSLTICQRRVMLIRHRHAHTEESMDHEVAGATIQLQAYLLQVFVK